LQVIAVLAIICLVLSCGKKGPPEPPTGDKPPAVSDLGYRISATTIKLSWTVPPTTEKATSPVAGFLIYRNQESLALEECANCPVIFKPVGDVPSPRAEALDRPVVYTQELAPGYRYIFKVRAYDEDGMPGGDSNFVRFNY
jgi:predicted small lipoprotein YifL